MTERVRQVTFQGNPLTLLGEELAVGDTAPDFVLLATDLKKVALSQSAGKVRIISVVPSLDTPVCDTQTRQFNEKVEGFGDQVVCYTVSADLPFAQARWCGAAGLDRVQTLSDHRAMAFGDAYGTHIKELRIETRAVFVVDAENVVRYVQYVPEMADEPDYDAALAALHNLVG